MLRRDPKLYQKKDGYYYLIFYDPETRKRTWKSLGTRQERRAQRRKARIIAAWERGEYDPQEGFIDPITLEEAVDLYIEDRGPNWTPKTMNDLDKYWGMVKGEIGGERLLPTLSGTDFDAIHYREDLRPASRHSYYRRSKALLRWCRANGYLHRDLDREMRTPKKPDKKPLFYSKTEFGALYKELKNEAAWMRPAFKFAVSTGMRFSEIRNLKWEDVDQSSGFFHVLGKGDKERYVPIFPMASEVLEQLSPFGETVFQGKFVERIENGSVNHALKRALRTLEMNERYNFHTCRHTFASWLVIEGVPLQRIQQWLGHESITTTEMYAHLAPKQDDHVGQEVFSGL